MRALTLDELVFVSGGYDPSIIPSTGGTDANGNVTVNNQAPKPINNGNGAIVVRDGGRRAGGVESRNAAPEYDATLCNTLRNRIAEEDARQAAAATVGALGVGIAGAGAAATLFPPTAPFGAGAALGGVGVAIGAVGVVLISSSSENVFRAQYTDNNCPAF
jgi:hypothetical protein